MSKILKIKKNKEKELRNKKGKEKESETKKNDILAQTGWRSMKREREKGKKIFVCFSLRYTEIRPTKFIHASRAMCGYQNLGVLSNSRRYRFFLLGLFLA